MNDLLTLAEGVSGAFKFTVNLESSRGMEPLNFRFGTLSDALLKVHITVKNQKVWSSIFHEESVFFFVWRRLKVAFCNGCGVEFRLDYIGYNRVSMTVSKFYILVTISFSSDKLEVKAPTSSIFAYTVWGALRGKVFESMRCLHAGLCEENFIF